MSKAPNWSFLATLSFRYMPEYDQDRVRRTWSACQAFNDHLLWIAKQMNCVFVLRNATEIGYLWCCAYDRARAVQVFFAYSYPYTYTMMSNHGQCTSGYASILRCAFAPSLPRERQHECISHTHIPPDGVSDCVGGEAPAHDQVVDALLLCSSQSSAVAHNLGFREW